MLCCIHTLEEVPCKQKQLMDGGEFLVGMVTTIRVVEEDGWVCEWGGGGVMNTMFKLAAP